MILQIVYGIKMGNLPQDVHQVILCQSPPSLAPLTSSAESASLSFSPPSSAEIVLSLIAKQVKQFDQGQVELSRSEPRRGGTK